MIAKCKAISHGKEILNYAMRESKMESVVSSNLVMGQTADEIFQEMEAVNSCGSRCKNKYLRFEIGIAPQDEKQLSPEHLTHIVEEFAKKMGLENHQWIACTHKDTDNLHIHLIANRIGIDRKVYQTDFVSNRSAHAAEEISREMGLTIAKEVKAEKEYINRNSSDHRTETKRKLQEIAYRVLATAKSPPGLVAELRKQGIEVEPVKNKQGKMYGVRFCYEGETFKASEIGREFGFRSMFNHFGQTPEGQKGTPFISKHQDESQPIINTIADAVVNTIVEVASNGISTAGEVASAIGGLFDMSSSGEDSAESEFQYLLKKDELKRKKKKRGRGI
jgi:hypothetical protein